MQAAATRAERSEGDTAAAKLSSEKNGPLKYCEQQQRSRIGGKNANYLKKDVRPQEALSADACCCFLLLFCVLAVLLSLSTP
jgi:hypothetical protein